MKKASVVILAILGMVFVYSNSAQAVTLFSDNFNGANISSAWTITVTGTGNVNTGTGYGTPYTGDATNYAIMDIQKRSNIVMDLTNNQSTSGYNNIHLLYYRSTNDFETGSTFDVYYRIGSGLWSSSLDSITGNTAWASQDIDLSSLNSGVNNSSAGVDIKFVLTRDKDNSASDHDYGLIEDVFLTGDLIGGQGTVIPEPATLSLLGLGLLGILGLRRKKVV